ncbi:MAG: DinB family protein, partial [candidate division Zixibacteria bacterium]|nr:DinB family protein [candidate division Zixibacteria bacterium]
MRERKLTVPDGYDLSSQRLVASFASQLDDQLRRLKEAVAELSTAHLEWQPHPGVNTVGMLLAHIAVAEAFWINVAPAGIPLEQDGDNLILKIIGIRMDDDGLPLKPDGHHPATLSGKSLADYLNILDKMRAATNATIRTWHDTDLDNSFTLRDAPVT